MVLEHGINNVILNSPPKILKDSLQNHKSELNSFYLPQFDSANRFLPTVGLCLEAVVEYANIIYRNALVLLSTN